MFIFKWLYRLSKRFAREIDDYEYNCEMRVFERIEKYNQQIWEFLERNDRVISVKRVEFRTFYDSTWEVRMLLDSKIVEQRIVRQFGETALGLAKELIKADSVEALKALDERDNIYYD